MWSDLLAENTRRAASAGDNHEIYCNNQRKFQDITASTELQMSTLINDSRMHDNSDNKVAARYKSGEV